MTSGHHHATAPGEPFVKIALFFDKKYQGKGEVAVSCDPPDDQWRSSMENSVIFYN